MPHVEICSVAGFVSSTWLDLPVAAEMLGTLGFQHGRN